nr:MAG TPA: hypothetical protein [Caudoviricetes sp.]
MFVFIVISTFFNCSLNISEFIISYILLNSFMSLIY